jgi:arylformamidase
MAWDLTWTLDEEIPLFPGMPKPSFQDVATVARDGYGMSLWTFRNHLGTHIDGPTHFVEGKTLDQYGLDRLIVPAAAVFCDHTGSFITSDDLAATLGNGPPPAVILITGQWRRWGRAEYFGSYPVLTLEAADWLIDHGVNLVAVDTPSVDPVTDDLTFPVHRRLLARDCLIIENLAWAEEIPARLTLCALPLKVRGANGSPARVVAWAR